MDLTQSIYETRQLLTALQYQQWRAVLFSYQWWILLGMVVGSWVVWWKLVDRSRLFEVLSFTLMVVIIGTSLDTYGYKLGLWSYPIKVCYLNPGLIAGDWAMPPVVKALVYQKYRDWKSYFLAQIAVAAFFSFIGEPFLVWIGAYKMYHWSYLKSFPIYILVALFVKFIMDQMKRTVENTAK